MAVVLRFPDLHQTLSAHQQRLAQLSLRELFDAQPSNTPKAPSSKNAPRSEDAPPSRDASPAPEAPSPKATPTGGVKRVEQFSFQTSGLIVDISKHLIDKSSFEALIELAEAAQVEQKRDAMLRGEPVNNTEGRAALHTALRASKSTRKTPFASSANGFAQSCIETDVQDVLSRMAVCARRIRGQASTRPTDNPSPVSSSISPSSTEGPWLGYTNKPIERIINIGIGGSSLGPEMVCEALSHLQTEGPIVRFVSNVDGAQLDAELAEANPETTLFIVASKTFTTLETMTNATSAKKWLLDRLENLHRHQGASPTNRETEQADLQGLVRSPEAHQHTSFDSKAAIRRHFIALSTNLKATSDFGISEENVFEFWDWVGGRYSLSSAIGLSIMCAIGPENFEELLGGLAAMDDHFASAPLAQNIPVITGLLAVWYRNYWGCQSHAVIPYSAALSRFSAYLQQLDMESNGKSVTANGQALTYNSAPVLWGEPGTDSQHAFFQMLHQGTTIVPVDFIGFMQPNPTRTGIDVQHHHRLLMANMAAQAQALAFGKTAEEVRSQGTDPALVPHKTFAGNRPSTVISAQQLTPFSLGQLIALYEHRTFVQAAIWDINPFDQWGVELGKELANSITELLNSSETNPPAPKPTQNSGEAHSAEDLEAQPYTTKTPASTPQRTEAASSTESALETTNTAGIDASTAAFIKRLSDSC